MGAVSSLVNGFSRILWGMLFKCTGFKFVTVLNLLVQITLYATFRFTVHIPGLYFLYVFLNSLCSGGFVSIIPSYCHIVFGVEYGSKIFGIFIIFLSLANFLQYGFVVGLSPLITLDGVIYICLGIVVFALILTVVTEFQGPWKNSTEHLNYCYRENN